MRCGPWSQSARPWYGENVQNVENGHTRWPAAGPSPSPSIPDDRRPLFVQIAGALAADITRGRLRPGQRLPGTRSLAASLGVHRSTTVAAYAELGRAGLDGHPTGRRHPGGRRTCPTSRRGRPRVAARGPTPRGLGFDLPPPPPCRAEAVAPQRTPPGSLSLWGGVPDLRLVPPDLLARALRRAARTRGRRALAYTADRSGEPALRAELARLLRATRGLAVGPGGRLRHPGQPDGARPAGPGADPPGRRRGGRGGGLPPGLGRLRGPRRPPAAGPRRSRGPRRGGAAAPDRGPAPARGLPDAAAPVPHHGDALAPRRLALLSLARERRFAIVEDDYDHEFQYDGQPVLPLASARPRRHGGLRGDPGQDPRARAADRLPGGRRPRCSSGVGQRADVRRSPGRHAGRGGGGRAAGGR